MDKHLLIFLPMVLIIPNLFIWMFRPLEKTYCQLSTFLVFLSAILSVALFHLHFENLFVRGTWFSLGNIKFSYSFNLGPVNGLLTTVILVISFLVHFFSLEYMRKDPGKQRYFTFLALFTFSMLGLVLSDNLLILFIFWELVGFCSYLLIGFWWKKAVTSQAATKAFLVNRIGDIGLMIGIFLTWSHFETLSIVELQALNPEKESVLTIIGFCFFCGAISKSAQFPLFHWLPDAMVGPTPVSALIHAATMVAAGVYLLAITSFIYSTWVLNMIAVTGSLTAIIGATSALAQTDIKKVLAYSTVSQLGFMVIGVGVGASNAALFHLVTHAFFKAGLFLIAGTIIHQIKEAQKKTNIAFDSQNMWNMGGLRQKSPVIFYSYVFCMLGLAGLPFFSGFLSKDAILIGAFSWSSGYTFLDFLIPAIGIFVTFLTPVYMGRQLILVFLKPGSEHFRAISGQFNKPNFYLGFPITFLAITSLAFFYGPNILDASSGWLYNYLSPDELDITVIHSQTLHTKVGIFSALSVLAGFGIVFLVQRRNTSFLYQPHYVRHFDLGSYWNIFSNNLTKQVILLSKGASIFDIKVIDYSVNVFGIANVICAHVIAWIDRFLVDGLVNFVGWLSRALGKRLGNIQNGNVQVYILWSLFITILVLLFLIF